jgi:phosphoribosylformimino-5-aminoimidazole carboxamide ribotide isomerase
MVARMQQQGLQEVLCTDISKDGTLSGTNLDLYVQLKSSFPDLRWIASGGVSGASDLEALEHAGIDAVVVGKAYYEGHLSLEEMAYWNKNSM